ncbi:phospholipase A [Psychrobacter sp.]|uniref:phospholipase A n=1 Tax=Psychrobacter sp. TaxID=56811 RepID=UPI0025F1EF71|nr:phospholipase A [Psychrobacter sp.]
MITLRAQIQINPLYSSKLKFLSLSMATICLATISSINSASAATNTDSVTGFNTNSATIDMNSNAQQVAIDNIRKCADLKLPAARLACYDKVTVGEELTVGREKTPVDLAETVKATFSELRPTLVFATDDAELNSVDKTKVSPGAPTAAGNQKLAEAGITVEDFAAYTPLSLAYDLDKNSEQGVWTVRPHQPIYLLPAYVQYDGNRRPQSPTLKPSESEFKDYGNKYDDNVELKAQVSLKTKILEDVFDTNADVWFGYTQQMHWQVYNEANSRPFRATDYMPEFFITQPVKANLPFNGKLRMLGAGAIHHSNGQSDPWSRSWNRVYLMGGAEWGKLSVVPKIWTHIKDSRSSIPSDNPDITDYYGHGELQTLYDFGKGETLAATGRYNFDTEKGGIELDYTLPLTSDLHGFIQLFHGYGESIIDYNKKTTAVGVGISLNDWKGL